MTDIPEKPLPPHTAFSRATWRALRYAAPLSLPEIDLVALHGCNEVVTLEEVKAIYLPLSRFLSHDVLAEKTLYEAPKQLLEDAEPKAPYVIGVTGSVAVGKSTTSRLLQALLSHWPDQPHVDLLSTDAFLHPNIVLERSGLAQRKGFPESYDMPLLQSRLQAIKAREKEVSVPIYSHHIYDIVPGQHAVIDQPDILILEGLNVLQPSVRSFLDFSVFVDAKVTMIKQWFIDRVLNFYETSFREPGNYFHFLTEMNQEELVKFAERVWREINEVNLIENVLPFRDQADLILTKEANHAVQRILLRKR